MESGGGVVQAPPVDSEGVEPPTSALSGYWIVQCDELRVTASIHPARYQAAPRVLSVWMDLNHRPLAPKTSALPG